MKAKKNYIRDGRAPIPEKELTSWIMSSIKAKNTKPEIILRKGLWSQGIRGYRIHWKNISGRPDIAFLRKRLAIFVNGCFWHRCPNCSPNFPKTNKDFWEQKFEANKSRDMRKKDELESSGWRMIFIWECQIKKDLQNQLDYIKEVLNEF